MLTEPAPALTDLILGLFILGLAFSVRGPDVNRYWARTFWWAAAAALAGAVHHGLVTRSEAWAGPSWGLISGMIVMTISFTLAATVHDVLGPGRRNVFWLLRVGSLAVYAGFAVFGHYGVGTMLACEGVTMIVIVALWVVALRRGHPRAPAVLVALGASMVAGGVRALPDRWTEVVGLDPTSLYHLAQIPGMLLLFVALNAASRLGEERRWARLGARSG